MLKKGFTLSEVLIAMAMVGIIAAITIPTFMSSNQAKIRESRLATALKNFETALGIEMLMKDSAEDINWERVCDKIEECRYGNRTLTINGVEIEYTINNTEDNEEKQKVRYCYK